MSRKNNRTKFLLACVLAALLITACRMHSPTAVSRQNLSSYYRTEEKMMRPKFSLFNVTDSMTRLYFTITSEELLYTKSGPADEFSAKILVSYTVHPVDFLKLITDSGHVVMNDVAKSGEKKQLAAFVDMDIIGNGRYVVEVAVRDLNKMTISYALLHLDHRGGNARNNFIATQPGTETPVFRSDLDSGEAFSIRYYDPNITRLFVHYYVNRDGPAPPPFAIYKNEPRPKADSSWWVDISAQPSIRFDRKGYYRFTTDSATDGGFVLSCFYQGFPEITQAKELLYPLRYLVMKQEYTEMDTALNTKKAVDKFWLNASGSEERARELIRNYYNRVAAANALFTTEKEGWKTDRGMIYLVFGPPQNVYRNSDSETWIYNNDMGPNGLGFVFDYNPDGWSDEEYVLSRNANYKVNWIQAVDAWRQGHVYTLH